MPRARRIAEPSTRRLDVVRGFGPGGGLRHGWQVQEAGAELGDFAGGAGLFVGDGIGAFEI